MAALQASRSRQWPCRASCRSTSPGRPVPRPTRRQHRLSYPRGSRPGGSSPTCPGVGAVTGHGRVMRSRPPTACSSTGPSGPSDELPAARARHQARGGHGPCAGGRSGREPRPPGAAEAQRRIFIHSEQQQSAAARRLARARPRGGGGLGSRLRRHGGTDMTSAGARPPLSRDEFIEWVRREGEHRYHDHHRYHVLMHDGKLTQLPAPAVGAEPVLLPDAGPHQGRHHPVQVRRTRRSGGCGSAASAIHDGDAAGEGGLELWLRLAEGVGLDRRRSRQLPLRPARRAVRLRRLRGARAGADAARGRRVVAHRVLLARPDDPARAGLGAPLPVDQPQTPSSTSARDRRARARTRWRPSTSSSPTPTPTSRRRGAWRRSSGRPRSSGICSIACTPPTSSRAGGQAAPVPDVSFALAADARPRLAPKVRLRWDPRTPATCCSIRSAASC